MIQVAYLLLQAKPNDEYEAVGLGLTSSLSYTATVDELLEDVAPTVCNRMNVDASQKMAFRLHFLWNAIPFVPDAPIEEIEKIYGPFNKKYFADETDEKEGEMPLSRLLLLRENEARIAIIASRKRQPEYATNPSREDVIKAALKRDTPSIEARPSTLRDVQKEDCPDAIYNGYPFELSGPHIAIYHPIFATFLEKMQRPLVKSEYAPEELVLIWGLMCNSLALYETKTDRKRNLGDLRRFIHNDILSSRVVRGGPRSFTPDGIVFARCDKFPESDVAASVFCEIENEMGYGESDPLFKAQCGYVAFYSADARSSIREACCCPAFIIGIAGPHLCVAGAIFTDRFISQRLTGYVYLGELTTPDERVVELAKVFRVIKECLQDLEEYYSQLSPRTLEPHPFPQHQVTPSNNLISHELEMSSSLSPAQFPHFKEFRSTDNQVIQLRYTQRLSPRDTGKAIYKALAYTAGTEGYSEVVVKFAPNYCRRGHELLAQASLAPKLWFCEQVESVRQWVIVMDLIDGTVVSDDSSLPLKAVTSLREAVSILHANDLVYGDLQAPSIVLPTNYQKPAILVHFNWCGEEGKARYPVDFETASEPDWHPDVGGYELIRKEHDSYRLNRLEMKASCQRPGDMVA